MIHVAPAPEPATFDVQVRQPGLRAIAEMVGRRPARSAGRRFRQVAQRESDLRSQDFPEYWIRCVDDLMDAYGRVCAYSCFRIHPVTGALSVDHMAPRSRGWDKVYEWKNYRLACSRLNARKRDFGDILDPFEIQDGWFELELVGFQVLPAKWLDFATRQSVQITIDRLGLDDFRRDRARDAENYWNGRVCFDVLMEESPFVARELRRQRRLRPEDT